MNTSQTEFPFPEWAERERLLAEVVLPPVQVGGDSVSERSLFAVLSVIAKYSECFLSQKGIAKRSKIAVRTVKRAIRGLERLNVITSERKHNPHADRVLNHHRVVWGELQLMCNNRSSQPPSDQTKVPVTADQGASDGRPRCQSRQTKVPVTADQSASDGRPRCQSRQTKVPVTATVIEEIKNQPPTNQEWDGVVGELLNWGLQDAKLACSMARDRGVSIADVKFWRAEAGKLPERVAPGRLHNWLTGRSDPPPRRPPKTRSANQAAEAEAIRRECLFRVRGRRKGEPVLSDDPEVFRDAAKELMRQGLAEFLSADERDSIELTTSLKHEESVERCDLS